MKAHTEISVNVSDLSSVNDPMLAMLLSPVTKSRMVVNPQPKMIGGMAVVLDCERDRAKAIVEVIRMKYNKNKIRIYDGKKQI